MTSKEWVIHKRLDDANAMPRLTIPRGTAKSRTIMAYFRRIIAYYNRPIYVENPPINILKGVATMNDRSK